MLKKLKHYTGKSSINAKKILERINKGTKKTWDRKETNSKMPEINPTMDLSKIALS